MADYEKWSDAAIRQKLAELGHPVGPITETTRKVIIKKLARLTNESTGGRRTNSFSSSEDENGGRRGLRRSMPPPASYRRVTSSKTPSSPSLLNSTIGDFRDANSSRSSVRRSTSGVSVSSSQSRRGRKLEYDFDSGSDSDFMASPVASPSRPTSTWTPRSNTNFTSNKSPTVSPRLSFGSATREPKSFISSLTRRTTGYGSDANNIKESDEEDGNSSSSFSTSRFHYPITSFSRPSTLHRPAFYAPPNRQLIANGGSNLLGQLKEKASYILWIGFIALLAILVGVYGTKMILRPPALTNVVYPVCTGNEPKNAPCVPREHIDFAVGLYRDVHPTLTTRAVRSLCGPPNTDESPVQPFMSKRELVTYLIDKRPRDVSSIETGVNHLALVLMVNPQWGVTVLRDDETELPPTADGSVRDTLKAVPSDLSLNKPVMFIAMGPKLSIGCRARLFFYTSFTYALASLFVGVVLYGIYVAVRYFWRQAKEQEEEMLTLVDRIIQYVAEHCSVHQEFIAVRHVHDVLISPKDRPRMAPIWQKAVEFLDKNESRIRREEQKIHEEDMMVWRLVAPAPLTPPPTPNTSNPSTDQHDNHLYPDLSVERQREGQRVWQGEAFETSAGSMNSLPVSPTQCLKIRHMFVHNKNYGDGWEQAVRDAIIEKCDGARILHVKVDSKSTEGCVYVKCSSPQEAGEAFKRLHGAWFDGALVTVKYLRLERYHERFPDAVNTTQPLRPSNDLRLSLGGKS